MMAKVGADHGLQLQDYLRGTEVTQELLNDPMLTVRMEQELALARNLIRELHNVPGMGLRVASHYSVTLYGALGWAMLSSATVRDALVFANQHLDLTYACCELQLQEAGRESCILVIAERLPADLRAFFAERSLMAVKRLLDDLIPGDDWLLWVGRECPEPPHADLYRDAFHAPLLFDQRVTQIVVDSRALNRPLSLANEFAHRLAAEHCKQLLIERHAMMSLASRIKLYITQTLPAPPSAVGAAEALGVSERTLRRWLAQEGVSFRQTLDDARKAMAEGLLLNGDSPTEVARRLGYAETSAFSHAFKRWYGTAPGRFGATRTVIPHRLLL